MDETRLSGDLPNLHVEFVRRASDDGNAEVLTLNLTATPDLHSTLPLVLSAWQGLAQAWLAPWMAPWMALARSNPLLPPPPDAVPPIEKV